MFARKNDDNKDDEEVEALREANALTYVRPSNISLIDRRIFKSYNFSSNSYELGSTFQLISNSGGDSVYGPSSYLRLEYTCTVDLDFGSGSILNLFKSIRLTHRSGEILEYIDNLNLLANLKRYWFLSRDDREKLDGLLGTKISTAVYNAPVAPPTASTNNTQYTNIPGAGTHVAIIPMSMLCGLFGNVGQMMPASLCAGMKLELELAPILQISTNNTGVVGAQITNMKPTLVLDSASLFDIVNKQLLSEQADVDQSGIQFTYVTYFNTNAITNSNAINIDVQQSASLTSHVIAAVRDNVLLNSAENKADSFKTIAPLNKAQWRLGSLYLPQQIITVPAGANWSYTQKNSQEWYSLGLVASEAYVREFHKAAGGAACLRYQSIENALTDLSLNSWEYGKPIYAMSLEKSPVGLQMTGEPTNNSRILNFNGQIDVTAGENNAFAAPLRNPTNYDLTSVRVDIFMCYVRVANLMGDNCVVDR